jgi:Ser/Thr protein kinase RdoA (MazF antagonist)
MTDKYTSRIDYPHDLVLLLPEVAQAYDLGVYRTHHVIPVGYEDLNLQLVTSQGVYFVKLFARTRTAPDVNRYVGTIEAVLAAGIRHPQLLADTNGNHLRQLADGKVSLVVMEWIEGESYWDAGLKPSGSETAELLKIAASINRLCYRPEFSYDSWAVNNFAREYQQHEPHLSGNDKPLVAAALEAFMVVDHARLPHGLVHGDLISTNVLRTAKGLCVIDFSVANYLPRIQEIAVLMSDLLFDAASEDRTQMNLAHALEVYQTYLKLESEELAALPAYIRAAHAMHVLQTSKFIALGDDDDENQHWLRLGQAGLRQAIN